MPASVVQIAAQYMRNPERIEVAPQGTATELVTQEMFVVSKDHKSRLLGEILKENDGSVLLFVRTRRNAGRVAQQIRAQGHAAAEIHADRSLGQRKNALRGFKTGEYRVLVATDIAARGIDVTGIELVVNYDLPDDPENYVHRIGRTGRAGREGRAISFATPDQGQEVRQIEKMLRTSIPCGEHPDVPSERFIKGAVSAARSRKPAPRGQQGGPNGMRPVRRSQGAAPGNRHSSHRSGVFGLVRSGR
jgi:ATP-dependent RNA helicase RhlE